MQKVIEKIKDLQKKNRWIDIVQLSDPYLLPEKSGWANVELLRAAGFAHSQLRHFPEAERYYRRWIQLEPQSPSAWYSMGYLFYLQKRFPEALDAYEKALKIFPDYLVCLYRKGVILVYQEKGRQAADVLRRLRELYESSKDTNYRRRNFRTYVKAIFQLGKAYYQLHLYQKAVDLFTTLIQIDKKDFVKKTFKLYNLGKNYLELGRLDEAIAYLKEALKTNEQKEYIWERLGRAYHVKKDYGEALKHFARALDCKRVPYIFVSRAETYLAIGEVEKARHDFHTALKRDRKGRHKIYLLLGNIAMQKNHLEEAESYYDKAIDFKKQTYLSDFAEAHYALSRMWLLRNKKEKSKEELEQAMTINPFMEWDENLLHALDLEVPQESSTREEYY